LVYDHIARRQENIYTVIELIGSSPTSWEDAVRNAVDTASESVRDLRIAEVTELDVRLDDKGKIAAYRAKIKLSFKYEKDGMD
jgi:dodecin